MRLSNGVKWIENKAVALGTKLHDGYDTARAKLSAKREDLRIEVIAQQQADAQRRAAALRPLDRFQVDTRVMEIRALREATEVRKAEARLRRDIARRIKRGEISLEEISCSRMPSSPLPDYGY